MVAFKDLLEEVRLSILLNLEKKLKE